MRHPFPRFECAAGFENLAPTPSEIVVIYDDRESFQRATQVLRESVCDLSNAIDVCLLPWRFAEIQLEPWRDRALQDAADADMLVVSASADKPLPDDIIEWIATSFTRRSKRGGKVMVIHGHSAEGQCDTSWCCELVRRIASFSGIEFVTPHQLIAA